MKTTKINHLISILIPVYNCEEYVCDTIDSVLSQTHKNIEVIIVDDCSTDNSLQLIKKYKDTRIRLYENNTNLGRPKTFNRLLDLMDKKSKYFTFIGSDDVVTKELIKDKIKYLEEHKDIYGLGSSIDYVDSDLSFIKNKKYQLRNDEIKNTFLINSPFSQGGMLLRAELKNYKFNEKYKVCIDYELWCRLISKYYMFENLPGTYYYHRQHEGQAKQKNLKLTIWNTIKIKSNYLFKPKYFSLKALIRYTMEIGLLFIPKKIILWLFYKIK